jgi:hypothetical protein
LCPSRAACPHVWQYRTFGATGAAVPQEEQNLTPARNTLPHAGFAQTAPGAESLLCWAAAGSGTSEACRSSCTIFTVASRDVTATFADGLPVKEFQYALTTPSTQQKIEICRNAFLCIPPPDAKVTPTERRKSANGDASASPADVNP